MATTPYCSNIDVQNVLGVAIQIGATQRGATTEQADSLRAGIAAEINAALGSGGLFLPITDTVFTEALARLNALGVAAQILLSAFPTASGPGSTSLGQILWAEYTSRLKAYRKGDEFPFATVVGAASAENFFTLNNALGGDSDGLGVDSDGDQIFTEPFFKRSDRY